MPSPGKIFSWSIRTKLLLLLLIVFIPASGIVIASALDHRNREIENARRTALLLLRSLVAQQEQFASGTKQMLITLAQMPEVQQLNADFCNKFFQDLKGRYPFYSNLTLVKVDGDLVAASYPFEHGSVNLSDRKYIKDTIRTLDFSAGEYIVDRTSNLQAIFYGYPVFDENHSLVAILTAGFRLDQYRSFLSNMNLLPPDSAVIINDHEGVRLFRYPENHATPVGSPPKEGFALIDGLDEGVYERTGDDGIYRTYAFKRLRLSESSPHYLLMIVGIPKDPFVRRANVELFRYLLILGIAALLALSVAWIFGSFTIAKPIARLLSATERLGKGHMDTRTDLPPSSGELGRLAKSFDRMAALLEAKDGERRRVQESLRETSDHLQLAISSSRIGIWDWNIEAGDLTWDDGMLRLYGIQNGPFPMRHEDWELAIHPDDLAYSKEVLRAALQGEKEYATEFRIIHPDGTVRRLKANGVVIRDSQGKPIRMIGLNQDITEQRQAEELIRAQRDLAIDLGSATNLKEALGAFLHEAVRIEGIDSGGVYLFDSTTGELHLISHQGLSSSFVGRVSHYFPGSPQVEFVMRGEPGYWSNPRGVLEQDDLLEKEGIKALLSIPVKWEGHIVAVLNLASHRMDFISTVTRSALEATASRIGGIIARMRAEEELRALPSRLLAAQEEERKRLAHELHDSIGGTLSAIKYRLEGARCRMEEGESTPEVLDPLIEIVRGAIEEARRIYMNLRPSILDDLGLIATLGWFLRQFESTHGETQIERQMEVEEENIPEDLKIVIFRVVQESFHNIAKYSQANLVTLSLRATGDSLELIVEDNGVGFDPSRVSARRGGKGGLGLTSMRERVERSGGVFRVESVPGSGTLVHASWLHLGEEPSQK